MERPGVYSWMVEVEYTQFKPDTDENDMFHMFVCKWPEDDPRFALQICVINLHKSGQTFAESILWDHGLKRSPPGMVLRMMGPNGSQDFFVKGPNTFVLENHGVRNVAYTNDPKKTKEAFEHECQQAEEFFEAHKKWLETPEGLAIANAYWKKHPSGMAC
jgi:hypothetical protein